LKVEGSPSFSFFNFKLVCSELVCSELVCSELVACG